MTEADTPSSSPEPKAPPAKSSFLARFIFWLVFIAVILGGAGYAGMRFLPALMPGITFPNSVAARPEADTAGLEQRIRTLESRVNDLSMRIDSLATASNTAIAANSGQIHSGASPDLSHLQSDLASLTIAMNSLQAEVRNAGSTASSLRAATQSALAEAIAFLQLRSKAARGHGFAPELAALRDASRNDPGLSGPLDRLTPLAEKGAPDMPALRDQFDRQRTDAEIAVAKTGAPDWWHRVLAELRGLISIRSLHGEASSSDKTLSAMQAALARDDSAGALEAMKSLPPEAQKALDAWRTNAEARQTIDEFVRAMADHLLASAKSAPPPKTETPAPAAVPSPPAPDENQDAP